MAVDLDLLEGHIAKRQHDSRPAVVEMMNQKTTVETGDVAVHPTRVFGVTDRRSHARKRAVRLLGMGFLPKAQELVVRQVDLRIIKWILVLRVIRDQQGQVGLAAFGGGSLGLLRERCLLSRGCMCGI